MCSNDMQWFLQLFMPICLQNHNTNKFRMNDILRMPSIYFLSTTKTLIIVQDKQTCVTRMGSI